MEREAIEILFGIVTVRHNGKPATAVVVNDQVATLADLMGVLTLRSGCS